MKILFAICLALVFGDSTDSSSNTTYVAIALLWFGGLIAFWAMVWYWIRIITVERTHVQVEDTAREISRNESSADATSSTGIARTFEISDIDDSEYYSDPIPYKTVIVTLKETPMPTPMQSQNLENHWNSLFTFCEAEASEPDEEVVT